MDDKNEKNKMIMEQALFHLLAALGLCNELDLSDFSPLEQKEWSDRINLCKHALEFTKDSVERLSKLIG